MPIDLNKLISDGIVDTRRDYSRGFLEQKINEFTEAELNEIKRIVDEVLAGKHAISTSAMHSLEQNCVNAVAWLRNADYLSAEDTYIVQAFVEQHVMEAFSLESYSQLTNLLAHTVDASVETLETEGIPDAPVREMDMSSNPAFRAWAKKYLTILAQESDPESAQLAAEAINSGFKMMLRYTLQDREIRTADIHVLSLAGREIIVLPVVLSRAETARSTGDPATNEERRRLVRELLDFIDSKLN